MRVRVTFRVAKEEEARVFRSYAQESGQLVQSFSD